MGVICMAMILTWHAEHLKHFCCSEVYAVRLVNADFLLDQRLAGRNGGFREKGGIFCATYQSIEDC